MDSSAFLRQVSAVPLLGAEQEVDLALCMRVGAAAAQRLASGAVPAADRATLEELVAAGDAARERMVQANLRLVVSVARRFTRTGLPLLDLVQDGTIGLIQAVDRFDPDQGFRFSTYAMWWIRQAISRGVGVSARVVHLPRQVLLELNTCHAQRQELMAALGREPTIEELADACGATVAQTRALLRVDPQPMSLDLSGADEHDDVADRHAVDPVEEAARSLGADRLQSAMRGLDPLEREVLSLRYGFRGQPLGCTAVAEALQLSRDRVRSIEARALRFLGSAPGITQLGDPPNGVGAAS